MQSLLRCGLFLGSAAQGLVRRGAVRQGVVRLGYQVALAVILMASPGGARRGRLWQGRAGRREGLDHIAGCGTIRLIRSASGAVFGAMLIGCHRPMMRWGKAR